ncbi:MAG: glycosyltransferase [Fluviicola sp.]|nr:glycosyltransferase [Fluviicola sp.]
MRPEHITGKTVLYGCLDWGSGHVARSIPLMRQLLLQENKLVVRCTIEQQRVFETYAIQAAFIPATAFSFRFKGDGNFTREMLRNARQFRKAVKIERSETKALVSTHGIDVIVSDHRYGMVSATIPSVFVTHQVQLPSGSGFVAQRIHRKWFNRFPVCWIMDDEQHPLAGKLSSLPKNGLKQAYYIGHYSRFSDTENTVMENSVVAVISGPEPYAKQLFELLLARSLSDQRSWTIVSPEYKTTIVPPNVRLIHNDWKAADEAIHNASLIISRNGYSTLMDLKALNKRAELIPTPGQLEQLYLEKINDNPKWKYL